MTLTFFFLMNQLFTFPESWINTIAELEQQLILSPPSKLLWILPKWTYGVQCLTSKSLVHTFLKMKQSIDKIIFKIVKSYFYPIMQRQILNNKMIFQQDGAPPHFSKEVRAWLNETFNGRWIGRGGPISWTPRSLDLMPLKFFLWGYIKTKVYKTRVNDIADLNERIEQEIKAIKKRHWKMFLMVL